MNENKVEFSVVSAVDDYENDPRMCLTSIHFPKSNLINLINKEIINPLHKIDPLHYYYKPSSLHITISGIQKISDPKTYTNEDVENVKSLFDRILIKHKAFNAYFYKLVILPTNLSLFGTSDPERDEIFFDINEGLKKIGLPNNNQYLNQKYFFCNMTICRFNGNVSKGFRNKISEINNKLQLPKYLIDSVSLIEANASLGYCKLLKTWKLKM